MIKDKLEEQLHEQYAINNNANLASIMVLIVSLISVVGIYGFIFIYSSIDFAIDWGHFVNNQKTYSLDVLLFATIASYIILLILFYLAAYLGVNQRKEQFITYAIRKKHYEQSGEKNDYDRIFPSNYHPFNKTKYDFIQGLYGEICCILKILFWIITILTLVKIGFNLYKYHEYGLVSYSAMTVIVIFIIFFILSLVSFCCIIASQFHSYQKRESEFIEKKWGLEFKNQEKETAKRICCIR